MKRCRLLVLIERSRINFAEPVSAPSVECDELGRLSTRRRIKYSGSTYKLRPVLQTQDSTTHHPRCPARLPVQQPDLA